MKLRSVLLSAVFTSLMFLPAVSHAAGKAHAARAHVAEVAPPPHVIILVPRVITPEARLPIRLKKLDVKAEVLGRSAHTRVEMTFYNPNERALEGELQFPLLDGQTVSGFALDIGGELRAAVPVEKEKGQEVFEDVIRARVDPALLEKTQGNNYKVRVYPLPARGVRRIAVEYDEVLPEMRGTHLAYRLPLQFAEKVEQLDVAVHNVATPSRHSAAAVSATLGAQRLKVEYGFDKQKREEGSTVRLARRKYSGREMLNVEYHHDPMPLATTGEHDGRSYFYAERSVFFGKPQPRPAPRRIGLVWDASGSGAARDHGREFALLDGYFKALGEVEVDLVVARDRAEPAQTFRVAQGNWSALRKALELQAYDGATSCSALSPPTTTDLNLLFGDGLCNFGEGEFAAGQAPLFAVNAASSADMPRLRALVNRTGAGRNGGQAIDLLGVSPSQALEALTMRHGYVKEARSNEATELLVSFAAGSGRHTVAIAGVLSQPQATIELDWFDADGQTHTEQLNIGNARNSALAPRRWAAMKLERLETEREANRAEIRRLGKRFGMVTAETSLIVLDRVEDYVRYEIEPHAALRAEYEKLMAGKRQADRRDREKHLDEVAEKFREKQKWWDADFPKGAMPEEKKEYEEASGSRRERALMRAVPTAVAAAAPEPRPAPMAIPEPLSADAPAPAPTPVVRPAPATGQAPVATIRLKKWEADAPYMRRLKEAGAKELYRVYLDERPSWTDSTAFFLDASDIFFKRGQTELGLRVLSNLAEMNLENRHILRILAYRLTQAKQPALALPVLKRVLALSPNEPQSWRDLGLVYEALGRNQEAADHLWEVISRPWHGRFPDIELIALAELNAVIARAPKSAPVNVEHFDERLLRNLPLDVRAVLGWDADNADIDLWVTDPNGDKVYYGHNLSYQGGRISRDFTGGYGPEEFSLRKAKPGKYKVEAHFYGSRQQIVSGATTLMLRLSTGFGTPEQKDEQIVLRLTGRGDRVTVGEFQMR